MLDPDRLTRHPILAQVGVVIPVAPFGRPVPQQPWLEFRDRTGIPVVIDGAASFTVPSQNFVGALPVAVSFHATKGFGTGEGGAVVSTDTNLITQVMRSLNFGFLGSRDSSVASVNGKMSEYHAAVGLAEFDGWEQKRRAFQDVASCYRQAMEAAGFRDRILCHTRNRHQLRLVSVPDHRRSPSGTRQIRSSRGGFTLLVWYRITKPNILLRRGAG